MATSPQFSSVPNAGTNLTNARISTANTNRDGTGTVATILTGGASGTRVDRILAKATVTTTAGMIRLFLEDTQGTPAIRLIGELIVTAITPTASVKSWEGEFVRADGQALVIVPNGWKLRVSTHNAETFDVVPVVAGDL